MARVPRPDTARNCPYSPDADLSSSMGATYQLKASSPRITIGSSQKRAPSLLRSIQHARPAVAARKTKSKPASRITRRAASIRFPLKYRAVSLRFACGWSVVSARRSGGSGAGLVKRENLLDANAERVADV